MYMIIARSAVCSVRRRRMGLIPRHTQSSISRNDDVWQTSESVSNIPSITLVLDRPVTQCFSIRVLSQAETRERLKLPLVYKTTTASVRALRNQQLVSQAMSHIGKQSLVNIRTFGIGVGQAVAAACAVAMLKRRWYALAYQGR
ncbi:hypothetical protein PUNSTDRAFT_48348 [Punctularia strigosozonata HHB-11173 SS5]|uniref:uncharacterized protein n=1 Tax=Punctularia strigosozonata (strain HHB-11173) TaxID=741275 RepID=UPI0004416D72|nr:uncharacterized protein PUNSTDRAFT_48348 [Punctularia strigosozonata HHB-11173 SS5]EIN13351.1 hypothetical protein PUNSTDRAFT_48348 [Punctularia strigosozonata HHB-11173 SS5]